MMQARHQCLTFSIIALLLAVNSLARAEDSVLLAPGAVTPFDPVFAPAVGPNEEHLAISLKQPINPDYIAATKQLEFVYAQPSQALPSLDQQTAPLTTVEAEPAITDPIISALEITDPTPPP